MPPLMSMSFHIGEPSKPPTHRKMVHILPQMKLLLLHPRTPSLSCLVSIPNELANANMLFDHGSCCDLRLVKENRHTDSINMSATVVWECSATRCFVDYWFEHSCVYLGSHTARIIQRAWRWFCERKRLALCMESREENSLLGRVLRTLCVEDLRRMTL